MQIYRVGTRASKAGPEDWFTGTVRIDAPFQAEAPSHVSGATVTFEPGARTAWHTHPLGQTILITSGLGRVQRDGGAVEQVRPGDIVCFAASERHWHGASPEISMTHIAVQESVDGKVVDWLEKVSDEDYLALSEADGA